MFDITKPVFGNWIIEEELGSGSYGTVYKIKKEDFGKTYYSALKVIKIPQNNSEIKGLTNELGDHESVAEYYKNFVQNFAKEIELMAELKGSTNIVNIEDHSFIADEDGIGWTILIKMELLNPFVDYASDHELSVEEIIRLGTDICNALEVCELKNIIHRDIKPDNIFVTDDGVFKLGDFGIAREVEKTTGGLSKKGTYTYMAPEVYKGEKYNKSVDMYSLGLVLYKLLNNNRDVFLPAYPQPITYTDRETSREKRFAGEELPNIENIPAGLNSVIKKACAYNPNDRYLSIKDFAAALKDIDSSSEIDVKKEEQKVEIEKETAETEKQEKSAKKNKTAIIVAVIVVLCLVVAGIFIFANPKKKTIRTDEITSTTSESTENDVGNLVTTEVLSEESTSTQSSNANTTTKKANTHSGSGNANNDKNSYSNDSALDNEEDYDEYEEDYEDDYDDDYEYDYDDDEDYEEQVEVNDVPVYNTPNEVTEKEEQAENNAPVYNEPDIVVYNETDEIDEIDEG